MTELWSFEAEEKILGYIFNPFIPKEKKDQLLQVLAEDHFYDERNRLIFHFVKTFRIYDKIVLWDKIQQITKDIEIKDLEDIDDIVTEEEKESYVSIIIDKYQKRRVYYFGKEIQEAIANGADQFEIALKAQTALTHIGNKAKLETNQELLDKVLNEEKGDVLSTGYELIDKFIGGYARGMIVTIAGDSGHLKTTFALDKAFKMAERNPNARIAIFSKEMLATDLIKKQISRICGIPTPMIFSQQYDKEYVRKKMMEIDAWRENRIRIINPNSFSGVPDIARIQMTHRFDIWFLDFIQLLEFAKAASNASDYNIQIGQNMRNLQALALATKSIGVVLSQVKKGVELRRIKKPTVSDIEWSGLIKQLSSYIFFSYYPGKYYGFETMPADYYYLMAEKTRFAEAFLYPMSVNPELGTFTEINSSEERAERTHKLHFLVG
jgi:replicative DNA helicase